MKKLFILLAISILSSSWAQSPTEYMSQINRNNQQIMQSNWEFLSAMARSNSIHQVTTKRAKVKSAIQSSIQNLKQMSAYKGNDGYRKAALAYQDFSLNLIDGETQKLVDMEAISQSSFDAMEAYVLYQRQLNYLHQHETEKLRKAQEKFAHQFEVELVEGQETELMKKIRKGSQVLGYKEDMFLVFARCSMYEMDMLSRINEEGDYDFSNAGVTLLSLVEQSRSVLDTITDINPDKSLRKATTQALDFFEQEAEDLIPAVNRFKKAQNNFQNFAKKFEKDPGAQSNQKMIDQYNAEVASFNQASKDFNNLLNTYNQKRTDNFNNWNHSAENFILKHMPKD